MDDPNADEISQYGQYCPISRAVEVLGERWSVLIVRDLLCGFTRFNELARGNPGLSRTLLSKRLRQLERAGIVEHVEDQYLLTPAGLELHGVANRRITARVDLVDFISPSWMSDGTSISCSIVLLA